MLYSCYEVTKVEYTVSGCMAVRDCTKSISMGRGSKPYVSLFKKANPSPKYFIFLLNPLLNLDRNCNILSTPHISKYYTNDKKAELV